MQMQTDPLTLEAVTLLLLWLGQKGVCGLLEQECLGTACQRRLLYVSGLQEVNVVRMYGLQLL